MIMANRIFKLLLVVFVLSAATLFPAPASLAAYGLTLTVIAAPTNVEINDDVRFTIRMGDASATDLCAFGFKIVLPDGLRYKPGTGAIAAGFQSATGMAMSVFDEEPYLMASGFGDTPYNGGSIDVAVFTCTAVSGGQMSIALSDVEFLNSSVKTIPSSAIPATVTVNASSHDGNQGREDKDPGKEGAEKPTEPSDGAGNVQPDQNLDWVNPFMDVSASDWFYGYVARVHSLGLMSGTSQSEFSPNAPMTRSMLVTALHRLAGKPESSSTIMFKDVPAVTWYTAAVSWAAENGVVNGVSATSFAPNNDITREQIVTMLFRFAKYAGMDVSNRAELDHFVDANGVSDYATDAISWAVASGIITGTEQRS